MAIMTNNKKPQNFYGNQVKQTLGAPKRVAPQWDAAVAAAAAGMRAVTFTLLHITQDTSWPSSSLFSPLGRQAERSSMSWVTASTKCYPLGSDTLLGFVS